MRGPLPWLIFLLGFLGSSCGRLPGQQVPDTTFVLPPTDLLYFPGTGPLVAIDSGHANFHTLGKGFSPFGRLLRQSGYRTVGTGTLPGSGPGDTPDVLVIANALNPANRENWRRPVASAFTPEEISRLVEWVRAGGRLLLIADHMPFAGAAADLGATFGVDWLDGFALTGNTWPPTVFRRGAGLVKSPISYDDAGRAVIDSVASFAGSAFRIRGEAIPVLAFAAGHRSLQPEQAWAFTAETPAVDLDGYLQGALIHFGLGRVAVFGEAAMFTAQLANGIRRVGFNAPEAPQNVIFVRRVMAWLCDGL